MIIAPDLTSHPKFIQLRTTVGELAMELLVRLWAHCQQNKRGQFWEGATPDYVEIVCAGGQPRKGSRVFHALLDCHWIHQRGNGIEIHDWNIHNAGLVSRWNRVPKSAQTPTQTPAQNPAQTQTTPPVIPAQTSAQTPAQEVTGSDRTGSEKTGEEREEPHTPSRAEFLAGFMGNGIPAEYLEQQFTKFDANHDWFRNGRLRKWRDIVSGRWVNDREMWTHLNPEKKSAAPSPLLTFADLYDAIPKS